MAQHARPDSDIQTTNWNCSTGSFFWGLIDEETPEDSDFVYTDAMATDTLIVGLSDVTDPESAADHIIRFRACSASASKGPETCTCLLYEGSTQIASTGAQTLTRDSFNTYQYALTEEEANAITDYTALRLHFIPDPGSGGDDSIRVSWAEFEVPDAVQEYVYTGDVPVAASPTSTRILDMVFTGALGLALLGTSVTACDAIYAGDLPNALVPTSIAAPEVPYTGAVAFDVLPSSAAAPEVPYTGDVGVALSPTYSSILDAVYTGDILATLLPNSSAILDAIYSGDIGVILSPLSAANPEALYTGNLPIVIVPAGTYSLESGGTEYLYTGNLPLSAIGSYLSTVEVPYTGQLSCELSPNSSAIAEAIYIGQIPLDLSISYSSIAEAIYSGALETNLIPASVYSLTMGNEYVYAGQLSIVLSPNSPLIIDAHFVGDFWAYFSNSHELIVDAAPAGNLALSVVNNSPYGRLKSFDGQLGILLSPTSSSIADAVYMGSLLIAISPSYQSIVDALYDGALPIIILPTHDLQMDRLYTGDLSLNPALVFLYGLGIPGSELPIVYISSEKVASCLITSEKVARVAISAEIVEEE